MTTSSADIILGTMLSVNLGLFGIGATYTKSDGEAISLSVWWEDVNSFQIDGYTAQAYKGVKSIGVRLSDTGKEPDIGETFTIDGTVYEVFGTASNDGYSSILFVRA